MKNYDSCHTKIPEYGTGPFWVKLRESDGWLEYGTGPFWVKLKESDRWSIQRFQTKEEQIEFSTMAEEDGTYWGRGGSES